MQAALFRYDCRPASQSSDAGRQFRYVERLYQIIICPVIQTVYLIIQFCHPGNDDHGNGYLFFTHGFNDGQSVNEWEHPVYDGKRITVIRINRINHSITGFSLSPARTEIETGGGQVLAQEETGSESDKNHIQITYTDNTVFQIVTISTSSQSELSREDTDKESVKKQSNVGVFGSCQDAYHWTADKILIFRYQ